jgi:hypothetical protein
MKNNKNFFKELIIIKKFKLERKKIILKKFILRKYWKIIIIE